MIVLLLAVVVGVSNAGPATENYKDQFCTDPRTMKKHAAYTEWADAYSCTRHRCQPGGRNLAIYTVGCKRVEAPESAIECEEVVEDTNMQFPYCCTRLRCLVVVRGEVWTRVLGQPWETLPAAPWSHMYKMKKPPPGESAFLPKSPGEGPIYELASDGEKNDKVLRSGKKVSPEADCNNGDAPPRSVPSPDIVIALSTTNDLKEHKKPDVGRERHKRNRKQQAPSPYFDDEAPDHRNEIEIDDLPPVETEKPLDGMSEEKYYMNSYGVTQKPTKGQPHHQAAWTEIPPNQWNEHDLPMMDSEASARDGSHTPDYNQIPEEKRDEKPSNLQALVDAIGTRMRDIENVVQRMSEKVHQAKPGQPDYASEEKRIQPQIQGLTMPPRKHHKGLKEHKEPTSKRPSPDEVHYKRFSVRNRGSKYLRASDATTEPPLFVEDTSMNGYFSDASNSLVRRANSPKATPQSSESAWRISGAKSKSIAIGLGGPDTPDPMETDSDTDTYIIGPGRCNKNDIEPAASTYMAPVETRRRSHMVASEASEEAEKKRKKHGHKKKKGKGRSKKKHHKEEKKKQRVNKVNSIEMERNVVSLEDSSALNNK